MTHRTEVAAALLHPLPLAAIGVLLANDHYLKANWGHPLTGKLSDFAGLLFFPLLLVAIIEVGQAVCHRYRGPSRLVLVIAVLTTGIAFALVQVAPPATEVYRVALAALQRPDVALDAWQTGGWEALPRVQATADPSDLLALPALGIAYLVGRTAGAATTRSGSAEAVTRHGVERPRGTEAHAVADLVTNR